MSSSLQLQLKLAISRLDIVKNKELSLSKLNRRKVSACLREERPELSRVRVRSLILSDIYGELLEQLQLDCELLLMYAKDIERRDLSSLESWKTPLCHILAASPKVSFPELKKIHDIIVVLYRKQLHAIYSPADVQTDEKFTKLLYPSIPSDELVEAYSKELKNAFPADILKATKSPTQTSSSSSPNPLSSSHSTPLADPTNISAPDPSTASSVPSVTTKPSARSGPPTFEELALRLERLKQP